jgi:hypothetical protein
VKHNLDGERVWARSFESNGARFPQLWFCRCPPSKERLIRNFNLSPYAIHSKVGHAIILSVYSAWRALIEPDFEPNYSILAYHTRGLDCAVHQGAAVIDSEGRLELPCPCERWNLNLIMPAVLERAG